MSTRREAVETIFAFAVGGDIGAVFQIQTNARHTDFSRRYFLASFGISRQILDAIFIAIDKYFADHITFVAKYAANNRDLRRRDVRFAKPSIPTANAIGCNHTIDTVALRCTRSHAHAIRQVQLLAHRHTADVKDEARACAKLRISEWFAFKPSRAGNKRKACG